MNSKFEYVITQKAEEQLDIDDIGNVSLVEANEMGDMWVLFIKTSMGDSYVFEYGPFNVDLGDSRNIYSSLQTIPYKETKLHSIIDNFLNNPKRMIIQAHELSDEEIEELKPNIKNLLEVFTESN